MDTLKIINDDCLTAPAHIPDESVDLGIFDPPFGIGEGGFDRHYKRDSTHVIGGYCEAPQEYVAYYQWTLKWMKEAQRVLKPTGSMYVVMGHSNLRAVLNAAAVLGLHEINHAIWKFNFGVYTKKKYVTSHYHVLYYGKDKQPTFNTYCRFGSQEVAYQGGKRVYQDLEDVFVIPKDNKPGEGKNQNKLPNALIQKMIQYSSNPGDMVCDFFMGNFTTAYVARNIGRKVCGFEINTAAFDIHMPKVRDLPIGAGLSDLRDVVNMTPDRQGEPVTDKELEEITTLFNSLRAKGVSKGQISRELMAKQQRGRFAIKNIIDRLRDDGLLLEDAKSKPAPDLIHSLFGEA